jgi:hypothetical protein
MRAGIERGLDTNSDPQRKIPLAAFPMHEPSSDQDGVTGWGSM